MTLLQNPRAFLSGLTIIDTPQAPLSATDSSNTNWFSASWGLGDKAAYTAPVPDAEYLYALTPLKTALWMTQ